MKTQLNVLCESYIFAVCYVKISKTLIMFFFSGNSFNVSQFRSKCVGFYVVIVKIRVNIVISTERKREQATELSR